MRLEATEIPALPWDDRSRRVVLLAALHMTYSRWSPNLRIYPRPAANFVPSLTFFFHHGLQRVPPYHMSRGVREVETWLKVIGLP